MIKFKRIRFCLDLHAHVNKQGAFIYGKLNENGDFSGNDIAYVYPDLKTVLRGTFKNGGHSQCDEKYEFAGLKS